MRRVGVLALNTDLVVGWPTTILTHCLHVRVRITRELLTYRRDMLHSGDSCALARTRGPGSTSGAALSWPVLRAYHRMLLH